MDSELQNQLTFETIRIKKSELGNFVFKNDDKEISINGEMYDIKNKRTEGDYFIFQCLKDKKETTLFAALEQQIKHNADSKSSSEKKHDTSSKNPIKDFFLSDDSHFISNFNLIVLKFVICKIETTYLSIFSPPPKGV